MDYSEACVELAKLIERGHYDYPESAGLAIQVFNDSLDNGETPKMALVFAKNLNINNETGITDND